MTPDGRCRKPLDGTGTDRRADSCMRAGGTLAAAAACDVFQTLRHYRRAAAVRCHSSALRFYGPPCRCIARPAFARATSGTAATLLDGFERTACTAAKPDEPSRSSACAPQHTHNGPWTRLLSVYSARVPGRASQAQRTCVVNMTNIGRAILTPNARFLRDIV